jgi:hypothetical protein
MVPPLETETQLDVGWLDAALIYTWGRVFDRTGSHSYPSVLAVAHLLLESLTNEADHVGNVFR